MLYQKNEVSVTVSKSFEILEKVVSKREIEAWKELNIKERSLHGLHFLSWFRRRLIILNFLLIYICTLISWFAVKMTFIYFWLELSGKIIENTENFYKNHVNPSNSFFLTNISYPTAAVIGNSETVHSWIPLNTHLLIWITFILCGIGLPSN